MAGNPNISGFDAAGVRAGLRIAMAVGLPVNSTDQPTFVMPRTVTANETVDQGGVPFDADYVPTLSPIVKKQVPCAIHYQDSEGKLEEFGVISPTRVVLTLLDEDYAEIEGFAYVVIGGRKFLYRRTEIPHALVTVGIYKIHLAAEDEG